MLYDDKKFIGNVIRNARKKAHLTQNELSEKIGMCEKNLGNIENGKQFPQVNNFLHIIEVLNISLQEFGVNYIETRNETKKELIKLILNSDTEKSKKYLKTLKLIDDICSP